MAKKPKPTQADQEALYESIEMFLHCHSCMKDKPDTLSPAEWANHEAGLIENGERLVLWCKRCRKVIGTFALAEPMHGMRCSCGSEHKLELGKLVATASIQPFKDDDEIHQFVHKCIHRHMTGDWGDLSDEDKKRNDWSAKNGERVLSSYDHERLPEGKLWIITEADRSITTLLSPGEY
jgi:hypothetical protein